MGLALTPNDCHATAINWNDPKCNSRINPNMPVHPRRSGSLAGRERATIHRRTAPSAVSSAAQSHAVICGEGTPCFASRKASASIPGQAKRKAMERQVVCATRVRAFHHVIHFRLKKIANESAHMTTQGSNRSRQEIAARGSTASGSQPIHCNPCTRIADSVASGSLCDEIVILFRTGELHTRSEAPLNSCARNSAPARYEKSAPDSASECIHPWRNSPRMCDYPKENSSPRWPVPEAAPGTPLRSARAAIVNNRASALARFSDLRARRPRGNQKCPTRNV